MAWISTKHQRKKKEYRGVDKSHKFYNLYLWRKLRQEHLTRNPLCAKCLERDVVTPAEHVHHVKPFLSGMSREEQWNLFLDPRNLISLCAECHREEHRKMPPLPPPKDYTLPVRGGNDGGGG